MNDDDSHPDRTRDERNLRAVRAAQASGDPSAMRTALGDLVGPYWEWSRSIAFGRLDGVDNRSADAEVIAQEVIAELVKIVKRGDQIDTPFDLLASINLKFCLKRYFRTRKRDRSYPVAELPVEAEVAAGDEEQSLRRQALEFVPYLEGVSEPDRELLIERLFLGVRPEEAAKTRGITRNALDVRYHRALKRLRQLMRDWDVRERRGGVA